jgi:hypothetical protein
MQLLGPSGPFPVQKKIRHAGRPDVVVWMTVRIWGGGRQFVWIDSADMGW